MTGSQRLSDRVLDALNLAIDQGDIPVCDHLVTALELSVTRKAGGAGFTERRDFPPGMDAALDRYRAIKNKG